MRLYEDRSGKKELFLKLVNCGNYTDLQAVDSEGAHCAHLIKFDKNGAQAYVEARQAMNRAGYDCDHFQFDDRGALVLEGNA